MIKKISGILLVLFGLSIPSFATHILGGELTYKYIGSDGPADRPFRYLVRFVGYVDRVGTPGQASNWGCGNLETNPVLFVFDAGTNAQIPKSDFEDGWNLPSHGEQTQGPCAIDPYYGGIRPLVLPIPAGCVVPGASDLNIAITDTTFEIQLPLSFSGYKVRYENCCRTENTTNLLFTGGFPGGPGNPGNTWLASIPSPIYQNSSPQFIGDAVPFFCRGDTTFISNNAFDPDGDRLIYSFATPYSGNFQTENTFSEPGTAVFAEGYSQTAPFGPNGLAYINPTTGLTKYYSNTNGNFAVAIDVQEYRKLSNGTEILLSTTRREFLVVVKDCEPNPPPTPIVDGGTSTGTTFIRNEGDSVVFKISAFDQNTTTISAQSELFDANNGSGQVAVCDSVTGTDTISTTFRWKIDCGITGGIVRNYSVVVKYQDEGCPPKTNNVVYTIVVNPFKAPDISGRDSLCSTDNPQQSYSVPGGTGRKWKAFGASITGNDTLSNISVNIPGDTAFLRLVVTSGLGCKDSSFLKIKKYPFVPIIASAPSVFVCQDSSIRINAAGGYSSVSWSPSAGLSSSIVRNPLATALDTTDYIVSSPGPGGCLARDTVRLTWIPRIANAGSDSILCSGLSRIIGANQPSSYTHYSYQWSPSSGLASDTSFLTSASVQNTGQTSSTFTFVQTATHRASNCSSTDTVRLFVKPLPQVNAGPDTAIICSGASVLIGTVDTSGAIFSWSPANGIFSPSADTTTASLNPDSVSVQFQKYFLTKTESQGFPTPGDPACSNKDSIVVKINPLPFFDLADRDSICSGFSTNIGTEAQDGFSYAWSPGRGLSATNTASTTVSLENLGQNPGDTLYSLQVTNNLTGCSREKEIAVRVNPLPVLELGADTNFCSGDTIRIGEIREEGFQYSWSPSEGLSADSVSDPLLSLINPNTGGSNQNYVFILTKTNRQTKCVSTDSLKVTVKPLPIAIAAASDTVAVCSELDLPLGSDSLPLHTYAWAPDTALNSAVISNPILNVNNPSQQELYLTYTVKVLNTFTRCRNSDSVVVKVNPLPIVPLAYADTMVCSRDTIFIGGLADSGYSYAWTPPLNLSDSSLALTGFSAVNNTDQPVNYNYNLEVTIDETGCRNNAGLVVQVNPLPDANAGPDKIICSKDSVQIGSEPVAGRRYQWSPETGLSDPTIANPVLTLVNDSTTEVDLVYTVTVVDTTLNTRCDSSDAMTITVRPLPKVVAATQDTLAICAGFPLQLGIEGESGLGYAWLPADSLSSPSVANPVFTSSLATAFSGNTYILTATNLATGCKKSDSVQVRVNALPIVNAGVDTSLCSGDSIRIGENAENGFSYSWSPTSGLGDSLAGNPVLVLQNPNTGGSSLLLTFKITKTNNGTSCKNFDSLVVEVKPLPIATAASSDTLSVCSRSDLALGDSALASHSYLWLPDSALSSASVSAPVLNVNNPSQQEIFVRYQLNVQNTLTTCRNTDSVVVRVNPLPIVPLAYADTSVCTRDTLLLGGNAETGIQYAWTPALQLNDSSLAAPQFTAVNNSDTAQTYAYLLQATNAATSCRDNRSLLISVNPLPDANAGEDRIICSRDSVEIGAAPLAGHRYLWTPATGLSNPAIANPKVAVINDGNDTIEVSYTVQVWDSTRSTGCDSSDVIIIRVKPSPIAVAFTEDSLAVCATLSAQLGIEGDNSLEYSWSPAEFLSADSISNPVFSSPTSPGSSVLNYVLTVTNPANSCKKSDTVAITVNPLPLVNTGTLDSLCSGDTIQIGPGAISVPNIYQWIGNGLSGSNPANPFLTLQNNSDTVQTQTYKLIVTNPVTGCKDSSNLNVRVNPLPAVNAGADRSICSGESTEIGQASQPGFSYSWNANTGLSSQTSANPLFTMSTPVAVVRQDTLIVLMTNTKTQCRKADEVIVTTNPRPAPVQFALFSPTVCPFSPGIAYQITNPEIQGVYEWSISGGTQASGDSSFGITVNWGPTNPTAQVKVLVTNQYGCIGSADSIAIGINSTLTPVRPFGDTVLCSFNKTGRIYNTALTAGSTYIWNLSNASVTSDTTTGAQLSVDWTINDGLGLIWIKEQSSTVDPATGTPIVCFGESDTLRVRINPSPDSTLSILGNPAVCANSGGISEYYSLGGFAGSSYDWQVTPSTPIVSGQGTDSVLVNWTINGNYQVIVTETSDKGCVGIPRSRAVKVNPLPVPGLSSLSSLSICTNDLSKAYIAQSAPGFENSTYSWTVTGGSPSTPVNEKLLGVEWGSSGIYQLVLTETSAQGCSKDSIIPLQYDGSTLSMKSVSLLENDESKVEIQYAMDNNSVNPSNITLSRAEDGTNNWVLLATDLGKETSSYTDEPVNSTSTVYKYKISSSNLCQRPMESDAHRSIVLKGFGSDAEGSSNLNWNSYIGWQPAAEYSVLRGFDENSLSEYEGGIADSQNPSYTKKNAGDGFVQWYRILAKGPDGRESYSNKIKLDFKNTPVTPNLFTPNNDGANDGFEIINLDLYPENELVITNRWGVVVFSKKNYSNADLWKGENCSDGVYYFKLSAPSKNILKQGWIEIKR